jgi:hypothetical protein
MRVGGGRNEDVRTYLFDRRNNPVVGIGQVHLRSPEGHDVDAVSWGTFK